MRNKWMWIACGGLAICVMAGAITTVPRLLHSDPCDPALSYAIDLGLQLSDYEEVISCKWHSSFPDSSGKVLVRTASPESRDALLTQSGVTEQIERSTVSINDGPFQEIVRRPNLERSEQIYETSVTSAGQLQISYNEGAESGLLLTVWALEF